MPSCHLDLDPDSKDNIRGLGVCTRECYHVIKAVVVCCIQNPLFEKRHLQGIRSEASKRNRHNTTKHATTQCDVTMLLAILFTASLTSSVPQPPFSPPRCSSPRSPCVVLSSSSPFGPPAALATLLECTLVYQQLPDAEARENLHDYAWAALELLIEEGCVELVRPPSPPTNKRLVISTTAAAAAETRTAAGAGSTRGAVAVVHGQASVPEPLLPASKRQKVVAIQQQGAQTLLVRVGVGTAVAVPCGGPDKGFQGFRSAGGGGGGGDGGGDCRGAGDGSGGGDDRLLVPTKLGVAIFRSSMPPGDGLMIYRDLSGEGGV